MSVSKVYKIGVNVNFIIYFSFTFNFKCARLSQFTLVKLVSKSVTPAGSSSVLNTVSSPMVKCLLINQLVVVMMPSTLSSPRLALVNTFQDVFSLI